MRVMVRTPRGWSSRRHVSLAMARAAFEPLYIPSLLANGCESIGHLLINAMGITEVAAVLFTIHPLALIKRGAKAWSMAIGAQKLRSNSFWPFSIEVSRAGARRPPPLLLTRTS